MCSHACRLLATHDDYSMTQRLPPGTKTFVTSLFRDPVDRVMSTYEFAAHIAARSMGLDVSNHPDETVMSARKKIRDHYTNLVNTDTRNIWPWTVLSVAMEEDLWTRVSERRTPSDSREERCSWKMFLRNAFYSLFRSCSLRLKFDPGAGV